MSQPTAVGRKGETKNKERMEGQRVNAIDCSGIATLRVIIIKFLASVIILCCCASALYGFQSIHCRG